VTDGELHVAVIPSELEPGTAADRLGGGYDTEPAGVRRLRHDIQHQLATISLLATLLATSNDIGESSQTRATQLVREARWLAELHDAYEELIDPARLTGWSAVERIRVDVLAAEIVTALHLSHPTDVCFEPAEAWTTANRLAVWRALRNVLGNAFRAAGPNGRVRVRVGTEGGSAVVQVDDDGPGFGAEPGGLASLGLGIVRDIVTGFGGTLAMATSDLGGCRVRVLLPAAAVQPSGLVSGWVPGDRNARTGL
jgi:signal transduction histidine kinase